MIYNYRMMKKGTAIIVLLCALVIAAHGQENQLTIEYTDINGNIRQVPVSATGKIVIFRSNGTAGVDMMYEEGELQTIATRRGNGSAQTHAVYADGALQSVAASRSDGSVEAHIVYQDGVLTDVSAFAPDGSLEAIIGYGRGRVERLAIADPDTEQKYDREAGVIEFVPAAQVTVSDSAIACEQ